MSESWLTQDGFDVRLEWGVAGTERLAPVAAVVVLVDVLRFTTAVDVAVSRGAEVIPHAWHEASGSQPGPASLSPARLALLAAGERIVLPSPNGSTCATLAARHDAEAVAGCLRNASAVAEWLAGRPRPVVVIACGERWPDGSLRPCVEDLLGAGAVISSLAGRRSPEAQAAVAAFAAGRDRLDDVIRDSASGRELEAKGLGDDLAWATDLDASARVPLLVDGRFVDRSA